MQGPSIQQPSTVFLHRLSLRFARSASPRTHLPLLALVLLVLGLAIVPVASLQAHAPLRPDEVDGVQVSAPISGVTVYLNQAQIERKGRFRVGSSGTHTLLVEGLSGQLQPASIQVKGGGSFTILDVAHAVVYPERQTTEKPAELKQVIRDLRMVTDSLEDNGYSAQLLQSRKQALEKEKQVLLANPVMNGGPKTDTLPALKDALNYLRSRLEDIHETLVATQAEEVRTAQARQGMQTRQRALQQRKAALEAQLSQPGTPVQQIRVTVYSKGPASGDLLVRYLVSGASWEPSYDLRSEGPGKPIALTYKANVRQWTGIDWEGVPLTLSTSDPTRRQSRPDLPVWYVRYYEQVQRFEGIRSTTLGMPVPEMMDDLEESVQLDAVTIGSADRSYNAQMAKDFTTVTQTFANVQFSIDLPYDIPSNGQPRLILVDEHELEASYRHTVVPKLDSEAYVEADVTGWADLNLLPGTANIFYEDTYIGRAPLQPDVFADTLSMPMGRDRLVRATRERVDQEEKTPAFSGKKVRSERWSIELVNGHSVPVALTVLDQIPVPADAGIEVELIEGEGAMDGYDAATGRLRWKQALDPGQKATESFAFRIRWDKERQLILR
jgi:uncharacterized protein (TIGR02231 family)